VKGAASFREPVGKLDVPTLERRAAPGYARPTGAQVPFFKFVLLSQQSATMSVIDPP
jgi:hypothetical protein